MKTKQQKYKAKMKRYARCVDCGGVAMTRNHCTFHAAMQAERQRRYRELSK